MIDQNNLKIYKGVPITIVTALLLLKRNASAKELMQVTGYTDKPVRDALTVLMQDHIVVKAGHASYMLAAYQLPLSWGETIERLPEAEIGDTPTLSGDTPTLNDRVIDLEARVLNLESALQIRRNSEEVGETPTLTGDIPNLLPAAEVGETPTINGETPTLIGETPNSDPETVNRLINNAPDNLVGWLDIDTNQPKESIEVNLTTADGETPNEVGEIPEAIQAVWKAAAGQIQDSDLLRGAVLSNYDGSRFTVTLDNSHKIALANRYLRDMLERILTTMLNDPASVEFISSSKVVQAQTKSAKPKRLPLPETESYPGEIRNVEICNEYLADKNGDGYSLDQLKTLVDVHPDPDVLRFALPTLSSFEAVRTWCGWDLKTAKEKLLTKKKVGGVKRTKLANCDSVTLEMIQDIFQKLDQELEQNPEIGDRESLAIWRIEDAAGILEGA